jgi:hypothetical protein
MTEPTAQPAFDTSPADTSPADTSSAGTSPAGTSPADTAVRASERTTHPTPLEELVPLADAWPRRDRGDRHARAPRGLRGGARQRAARDGREHLRGEPRLRVRELDDLPRGPAEPSAHEAGSPDPRSRRHPPAHRRHVHALRAGRDRRRVGASPLCAIAWSLALVGIVVETTPLRHKTRLSMGLYLGAGLGRRARDAVPLERAAHRDARLPRARWASRTPRACPSSSSKERSGCTRRGTASCSQAASSTSSPSRASSRGESWRKTLRLRIGPRGRGGPMLRHLRPSACAVAHACVGARRRAS